MLRKKFLIPCFVITLFFAVAPVFAEVMALHPLKGEPYEIADQFFDVLQRALAKFPGSWTTYIIDLDDPNWPGDVPPGGFSPILCPRPSITRGAPYVITGEVAEDPEYYESYRMRLYLWRMEDFKLLVMDELTAPDHDTCETIMPLLLDNMMPAIEREALPSASARARSSATWDPERWLYAGPKGRSQRSNPIDMPEEWIYIGPDPQKWLYIGIRGGGGSSQWYYVVSDELKGAGVNNSVTDFMNVNAAIQFSLHLGRNFDIQTEANVAADLGNVGIGNDETVLFSNFSLTVPLLLKLSFQGGRLKTGLYAGAYFYIPLAQANGDELGRDGEYKPDLPGFAFGASIGWKAGPGYLFVDGRFEYDGLWSNYGRDPVYMRNSFKANIGYEWGLGNKK